MSVEANGANLLLGRGKLYFDRKDVNGNLQGLRFLGDCAKLEIQPQATKKDRFAATKNASTKIASALVDQSHIVSIDMMEYQPENLALALLGDGTQLWAQGVGTATAEVLSASSKQGRIYQTAKRNITLTDVKVGATTCVLGTDYEVIDLTMGLIRILPGSTNIPDASNVTTDYTYAAYTKQKMIAGTTGLIEGKLVFIGDPTNGPITDLEVWRLRVFPNGLVALITDDFGSIPLQGEVLDDGANHPTEPLYRQTFR